MKPLRLALIAAAAPLAVAGVLLAQPGYQALSCAASTVSPVRADTLGTSTSTQIEVVSLSTLTGRGPYSAVSCRGVEVKPGQGTCGIAPPAALPEPTTAVPAAPPPAAVTGIGEAPATSTSRFCL